MKNFKTFYTETYTNPTNEDLGDVMGDIGASIKSKVKDTVKKAVDKAVPKGIQNLAGRLFNVENDITGLIDKGKFVELGELMKAKSILPTYTFVRYKDTAGTSYQKFPVMFVIYDRIVLKQSGKMNQAFLDIERGMMKDLKTYFESTFQSNDLITHYISQKNIYTNSKFIARIAESIPMLINFAYPIVHFAPSIISASFRTNTPSIFKAVVNSPKVKMTTEINEIINRYVNGGDAEKYKQFKLIVLKVDDYSDRKATEKESPKYFATQIFSKLKYNLKGTSDLKLTYKQGKDLLSALVTYTGVQDTIPVTSINTRTKSDIEYFINQIGGVLGRTGKVVIS